MEIKKTLSGVMNSKMDRKEFLKYAGISALGLIGVSSVVKSLQLNSSQSKKQSGYGSSPYGQ